MTTKDPLIGCAVTIKPDATTLKGRPHPQAGQYGTITGKTPSGQQYQVQCVDADAVVNLPMDAFDVLPESGHLAGVPSMPAAPAHTHTLPRDHIVRSRTNPREHFDAAALQALAASIKAYGIMQPILVRKLPGARLQDTFEDYATRHATHEIVAGERRWRAAEIAGLRDIPVLERALNDAQALEIQLLENLLREDLSPLEEARGFQRLMDDQGYTPERIMEITHKSRTYVYEALRLPNLCAEAKAALLSGDLSRSVALLVAQRPTVALQVEFTKRVLTGGPDSTPLSYRSAQDLARRSYMTDLVQAPFALDDALLCPKAGACTQCPKRTGASPELWDKAHTDICTDTVCFADKKEAHYERLTLDAKSKGRKVITGREAREIMPTEGGAPVGYMLLDKPRKGDTEPLRQLLGEDVPESKVVLIEAPSGAMVEAVPIRAAGAALEGKGRGKGTASKKSQASQPTREDLEEEYQRRWRRGAVLVTIESLPNEVEPESLNALPCVVAQRYMLAEARGADDDLVRAIFKLPAGFDDTDLSEAVSQAAQQSARMQHLVLTMLASTADIAPHFNRPADESRYLDAIAPLARVDIAAIKARVQAEMKAEAADRASAAVTSASGPADKAIPTLKPKADKPKKKTKAEAQAEIAKAMQAAEGTDPAVDPQPNLENQMYEEAKAAVIAGGKASISLVQRHMKIGYNTAARLLERMETDGVVSAMGAKGSREVLA